MTVARLPLGIRFPAISAAPAAAQERALADLAVMDVSDGVWTP